MNPIRSGRAARAVVTVAAMAALAACSDDDASESSSSDTSTSSDASATTIDDSWKEEAGAVCTAYNEAMATGQPGDFLGTPEDVAARRELRDTAPSVESIELPESLRTEP